MIGYDITPSTSREMASPQASSSAVLNPEIMTTNKKPISMIEKQQMAAQLETKNSSSNTTKSTMMTNSNSLISLNNKSTSNSASSNSSQNKNNYSSDLTDDLFKKNLENLSLNNNNNNQNKSANLDLFQSNFINNNSQQNGAAKNFSQFNVMNGSSNQQQLGFFGNLALPAPVNNSSALSLNQIPLIKPIPASQSTLHSNSKPPTNPKESMDLFSHQSSLSINQKGKTAADDLADIFG